MTGELDAQGRELSQPRRVTFCFASLHSRHFSVFTIVNDALKKRWEMFGGLFKVIESRPN